MKRFLAPILLLTLLFPTIAFGETLKDSVKTDGLYYKKFTDVPFTGKITEGLTQGLFRNGKWDGPYIDYHYNGRIFVKGTHKDGMKHGLWVWYDEYGVRFTGIGGTEISIYRDRGIAYAGPLPDESQIALEYQTAKLVSSDNIESVAQFFEFLISAEARTAFTKTGVDN